MSIVIGWNSFRLRSFTPSELNITTERSAPHFTIEARQSYFHLFWIPFFGIGKKWVICKNHALYNLPPEYEQHIRNQRIPLRTPWYTFAGPLLIVAGLLIWQLSSYMSERRESSNSQAFYDRELQKLDSSMAHLNDKYFLKVKKVSGKEYDKYAYLKVESFTSDSVTVKYVSTGADSYTELPMNVEAYYKENKDRLLEYTIHRDSLKASITRRYSDKYKMQRPGVALLKGDDTRFALEDANAWFGPVLKDRGTGSYSADKLTMEFTNEGWPAAIINLKTLSGGLQWENTLPVDFPALKSYDYPSIHLRVKGYKPGTAYSFTVELVDTSGARRKYLVEGVNLEKRVTLIQ